MEKVFLSEREVSTRYGIAVQTLRNWRSQNRFLPYHKIGKKVLYKDDEVYEAMMSRRIEVRD